MDILKQQQAVIKELRAEVAALEAKLKTTKARLDAEAVTGAMLVERNADLRMYKRWTYLQLIMLGALAVPKVLQLIQGL